MPEARDSGTLEIEHRASFASVALETLKPGVVLMQKYKIESVLGRGGMGVVVAALNMAIDQRVALKFLHRTNEVDAHKRLLREAFRLMQHDLPSAYDVVVVVRPHKPMILAEYQRILFALVLKVHQKHSGGSKS